MPSPAVVRRCGRLTTVPPARSSGDRLLRRPQTLLVDRGRLVVIDLPQVVDIVGNPQGPAFLQRDCANVCAWFAARGHPDADAATLTADLAAIAGR